MTKRAMDAVRQREKTIGSQRNQFAFRRDFRRDDWLNLIHHARIPSLIKASRAPSEIVL